MTIKIHRNIALGVILGLQRILEQHQPTRVIMPQLFKMNRQWGSRDRKATGKILFDILRWKPLFAYCAQTTNANPNYYWELIGAWCVINKIELPPWEEFENLSSTQILSHYNNPKLTSELRQSFPQWLNELGVNAYGTAKWNKEMQALNQPNTRSIRVNRLKSTPKKLKKVLWDQYQIEAFLMEDYPDGLSFKNHSPLNQLPLFKNGFFEVQDGNSQRVGFFCEVLPGQKVLDACAGSGGKSLHLATLMKNKGIVLASDIRQNALDQIHKRSQRNGLQNIQTCLANAIPKNWINNTDVVLIDAPCSGTGVIQSTPETKWLLTPEKLKNLIHEQATLLQNKAQYVKPDGKLVYVTCSILIEENQKQIEAFLSSSRGEEFKLETQNLHLSQETGFSGFFMASLRKRA